MSRITILFGLTFSITTQHVRSQDPPIGGVETKGELVFDSNNRNQGFDGVAEPIEGRARIGLVEHITETSGFSENRAAVSDYEREVELGLNPKAPALLLFPELQSPFAKIRITLGAPHIESCVSLFRYRRTEYFLVDGDNFPYWRRRIARLIDSGNIEALRDILTSKPHAYNALVGVKSVVETIVARHPKITGAWELDFCVFTPRFQNAALAISDFQAFEYQPDGLPLGISDDALIAQFPDADQIVDYGKPPVAGVPARIEIGYGDIGRAVFDSAAQGFAEVFEPIDGQVDIGRVGDIASADGFQGSPAEEDFNRAIEAGDLNPQDEALLFFTNPDLPLAKGRIALNVTHVESCLTLVHYKRVEYYLVDGTNLPYWRRRISRLIENGDIRALREILAAKPMVYNELVGTECVIESVLVRHPKIVGAWELDFCFFMPRFANAAVAIADLKIFEFDPSDLRLGASDRALRAQFPNVDQIVDYGRPTPGAPNRFSIDFGDMGAKIFDSANAGFANVAEPIDGQARVGRVGGIVDVPGFGDGPGQADYEEAINRGLNPDSPALLFFTNPNNPFAKIRIKIPVLHIRSCVSLFRYKRTEYFLVDGTNLPYWRRRISRLLADGNIHALREILKSKPMVYDRLVGTECVIETIVVRHPKITGAWELDYCFFMPRFRNAAAAISDLEVFEFQESDLPHGVSDDALIATFPGADQIVDYGDGMDGPNRVSIDFGDIGRNVFDSSRTGFDGVVEPIEGQVRLGQIGDIAEAPGFADSPAQDDFDEAVHQGLNPQSPAMVFFTNPNNPIAKMRLTLTVPHVRSCVSFIRYKRVEYFLVEGTNLPYWRRRLSRLIENGDIEAMRRILAEKPMVYDRLVGTECVIETVLVRHPKIVGAWELDFCFFMPRFRSAAVAISDLEIFEFDPQDLRHGDSDDALIATFPAADAIYDFGPAPAANVPARIVIGFDDMGRIGFDSNRDGLAGFKPTDPAHVGVVNDITQAPTFDGSLAQDGYRRAIERGDIHPDDPALIFPTDAELNPIAEASIEVPHLDEVCLTVIRVKRSEFFRLTEGSNLPIWRAELLKAFEDGGLQATRSILDKKPPVYDALVDDSGIESVYETYVIKHPIITGSWTLRFRFNMPGFRYAAAALSEIQVIEFTEADVPGGRFDDRALVNLFPNANQIVDFGDIADGALPEVVLNYSDIPTIDDPHFDWSFSTRLGREVFRPLPNRVRQGLVNAGITTAVFGISPSVDANGVTAVGVDLEDLGLQLNAGTGAITGRATRLGRYRFPISALDPATASAVAEIWLDIAITPRLEIVPDRTRFTIAWEGGVLQTAPTPIGPWRNVSPIVIPGPAEAQPEITGNQAYFRVIPFPEEN